MCVIYGGLVDLFCHPVCGSIYKSMRPQWSYLSIFLVNIKQELDKFTLISLEEHKSRQDGMLLVEFGPF